MISAQRARGQEPGRTAKADVLLRLLRGALLGILPIWVALALPAHASHRPAATLGQDPSGHQALEGLGLVSQPSLSAPHGSRCGTHQPLRHYDIVALPVDITVNRYGDHDPRGRMYVLANKVPAVLADQAAEARARLGAGPVPVTAGLQGDPIQPLTLRVLPGECLQIALTNQIPGEPASFHLHGLPLFVRSTGKEATATEPSAVAKPGQTVTYEWAVPANEPSETHYAHSHSNDPALERSQTEHGLYAAVVVEPPGSHWMDPRTAGPNPGWDAVVVRRDGSSFREFTLFYAEDGDEPYQPLTRQDQFVPLVDDLTGAYKPDGRWVNYRSEPFMNRLALEQQDTGHYDESGAYSSYAFGDPATPVMRSYVGDPVVQRVLHAGSEVMHVHHVHGGSIRWTRQPDMSPDRSAVGFTKTPDLLPGQSERTDAQSMVPSETFDQWAECGSGGCQQSVGDFLWHCHVAQHYFAGMWGLWRVYGTLQNGPASTDALPPLPALPDRHVVLPAVRASQLVGTTLHLAGHLTVVTPTALTSWLGRVLPPPGPRIGYSAGTWDWVRKGLDVLGEPEDTHVWPGYASRTPGVRPEVLFDPRTGLPAYPMFRPHLGQRPPFAPGHGPAPYLDPSNDATLPAPGADGPTSVCPTGTTEEQLPITALLTPVQLAPGITDPHGELYVPNSQLADYQQHVKDRVPLVLRARAQRDCVDVTLVSQLVDDAETHGLSKADLHIHFVQFDVQASDGVVAGFNPEQSVRPWKTANDPLAVDAPAGTKFLQLQGLPRCQAGETLAVGPERPDGPEIVRVAAVHGDTVQLANPLRDSHPKAEATTTEFVRYRWYPDAQTGTTYFHDHVDAISSWRHGLFGALVVEPPDATWTDPTTGAPLPDGPVADITTNGSVGVDEKGSFREFVALLQDDVRVNQTSHSTGGALGERASTPGVPGAQVRAYVGDPVVFRTLVPGTNDVHTFWVEGHGFRIEPWSKTSPVVGALHVGISERYDVVVPAAGGPGRRAGDYEFGDGRTSKLREGVWGILRVLAQTDPTLKRLSGRPIVQASTAACPSGARVDRADITALDLPLPMLDGGTGSAFVPTSRVRSARAHPDRVEPLTLHVASGDCVRITLHNSSSAPVGLVATVLNGQVAPTVGPGRTSVSELWAAPELGHTVAVLRDRSVDGPTRGLYGAIVIAPAGSTFTDSKSGAVLTAPAVGTQVVVRPQHGSAYRDLTLFMQDGDGDLGTHQMPYRHSVIGTQAISYRRAPATPTLKAYVGDAIQLHVIGAASEQEQGFALDGHRWPLEPGARGSKVVAAVAVGGFETATIVPVGGAGGEGHRPGQYEYTDTRGPYLDAGMWGVLDVLPKSASGLAALNPPDHLVTVLLLVLVLGAVVIGAGRRADRS